MTMTEVPPAYADSMGGVAPDPGSGDSGKGGKGGKDKKGKKDKAKGRSNLVPALVLAAGLAAGGYFMGGGQSAASTTETTAVVATPEPGEMVRLDPMTLNLTEGRFLRLGVAFEMTKDFELSDSHDEGPEFSPADEGRLRDLLISMFSGRDGDNLVGSDDREQVKDELLEEANTVLDGKVMSVYFTELVMQ